MTSRGGLGVGLAVAAAGAVVATWLRAEGVTPTIDWPHTLAVGAAGRTVAFEIADAGSGLRSVRVDLDHSGGTETLLAEMYPGNLLLGGSGAPRHIEVRVDPSRLGLSEGEGFLRVSLRDWSWRAVLRGNESRLDVPTAIDFSAPRIDVATGLTYVQHSGAGSVLYRVSEATALDGVQVGESFFRGFPIPVAAAGRARGEGEEQTRPAGPRVALFAVPTDAPPNAPVHIVAEDAAGNPATARWPVVVKERSARRARVALPERFLETVVRPLADAEGIDTTDLAAAFHEVNTRVRAANETRIRELLRESEAEPLWEGAFEQLPNSKVTSHFAERRQYYVNGKPVSEATHFGYDLAATAAAQVTASNRGRVVFVGDLGIYGNCVIIDHGLGLASLYGHLSRLDVVTGDRVAKGQRLGLSGATGLAGGDHLHFALLVGGRYVDPLEWWDPKWLETHVDANLPGTLP